MIAAKWGSYGTSCLPKSPSLLRFRCSFRNAWQNGTVVVTFAPRTFKPSVTILSLTCWSETIAGNPLPQTGCTKTVPPPPH